MVELYQLLAEAKMNSPGTYTPRAIPGSELAHGVGLQAVKERLGHVSIATTERYLHTLPDADHSTLDASAGSATGHGQRAAPSPYR